LRGAFVSGVLVAHNEHERGRFGVKISGAEAREHCRKKREDEDGAAHAKPKMMSIAAMRQARELGLPFDARGAVFT
jgi:hypothetical protein